MKLIKILDNGMKVYSTPKEWLVKMGDEIVARFDDEQSAITYGDDSSTIGLTVDVDETILLRPIKKIL